MIAQLIHTGPHPAKFRDMKGDANEALLIVGVTLFWAAVLPIASVFLAVAALCGRVNSSRRRRRWLEWSAKGCA
jgi:hypothetical protein